MKVVAEVKRSSPSKGAINLGLDLTQRVVAYESGGAAAISVLTEPTRFGGSNDDLTDARGAVRIGDRFREVAARYARPRGEIS